MEAHEDQVSSLPLKKTPRKRRRFEVDLPAPPPDPTPHQPPPSPKPPTSPVTTLNVEEAFDHLSKLYNLVEQIVEIRNKSSKLFNKVRQLERVKALKKANSELEKALLNGLDVPLPDEDVGFAESLLGAMLASSFEVPRRSSNISRASSSARRGGSLLINEQRRVSCPIVVEPRSSVRQRNPPGIAAGSFKKRSSLGGGLPKVSKWTRVKAAFKWEKAGCHSADGLGEGLETPTKLLNIPENNAGSSEVSGPPTPVETISSSSSIDDVFHSEFFGRVYWGIEGV